MVGRPPFTGANQFQLLRNIERSEARLPEALAAQLSPQCRWEGAGCVAGSSHGTLGAAGRELFLAAAVRIAF